MMILMVALIFVPLLLLFTAARPKGRKHGRYSGFANGSDSGYFYDSSGGGHGSSHHHCGDSGHSSSYDGGSCDSGGGDGGGGGGE